MNKNKILPDGYILYAECGMEIDSIGSSSYGIYFKKLEGVNECLKEMVETLLESRKVGYLLELELYSSKGEFIKPINIKLTKKMLNDFEEGEEIKLDFLVALTGANIYRK